MSNLFGSLREKANKRVNRLSYGIHDNVVITKVDITPRFKKDTNIQINAMMWITYSQLDAENAVVASAEQMIFNLDHNPKTSDKQTKGDVWANDMVKFADILGCYYSVEQIDAMMNNIFQQMGINKDNFEGALSVPDNMKKLCEFLKNSIHAALQPVMANEKLRIKVTYDKAGFPQVANFGFIEKMSQNPSKLAMGDYDAKMKANKETLDAKKQAEAVAGKVGGPGNASAAPPTGPAATPAPAATPPVTAAPAAAAPVAAPVADNNPLANGVQVPFTEAPAATAAPVAAPVADAIPAVNIPTVAAG